MFEKENEMQVNPHSVAHPEPLKGLKDKQELTYQEPVTQELNQFLKRLEALPRAEQDFAIERFGQRLMALPQATVTAYQKSIIEILAPLEEANPPSLEPLPLSPIHELAEELYSEIAYAQNHLNPPQPLVPQGTANPEQKLLP